VKYADDPAPRVGPNFFRGLAVAFAILLPIEILVLACAWIGLR